jgi:hypothetical protein
MIIKAAELIITRNEFYNRSYARIKSIVALLVLITILLIGFYIHQNKAIFRSPKYYPTTPDGRLILSPPVSENHLLLSKQLLTPDGHILGMPPPSRTYAQLQDDGENALVLYWARLAVQDMFDYDYVHYRTIIEHARMYFTPQGHEHFIQALIDSKNLETVKARSAVVVPQVLGKVKLVNTGTYLDHFSWDLEVRLRLTYESAADQAPITQDLLAKMSIARVTTLTSPFYGLSIYKLNFEQTFDQNGNADTASAPAATTEPAAPAATTAPTTNPAVK